jgi:hypothetical protein
VLENSLQDRLRAAPWILASYKLQVEKDYQKFNDLVRQLNDLLEQKERRIDPANQWMKLRAPSARSLVR